MVFSCFARVAGLVLRPVGGVPDDEVCNRQASDLDPIRC
jgi:hypothetical protein